MDALAKVRLNLRTVHGVKEPDLSFNLWGGPGHAHPRRAHHRLHLQHGWQDERGEFITEMVAGALMAGSICMTGDGADPTMFGSDASRPRDAQPGQLDRHHQALEVVAGHLQTAEEAGVLAVGMDIDGAGLVTMAMKGQPVWPTKRRLNCAR